MPPSHDPTSLTQLAARLSQVKHFRNLAPAQIQDIVASGTVCSHPKESTLFVENDPGTGLYVLLSGQVQLIKLSTNGQMAILAVFDPIIMFNEVAALDRGPAPATALASEAATTWCLDSDRLEKLLLDHPHLSLGLLRVLASHNRHLVSHFEDLSFRTVLARTAKLLLELSTHGAAPIDRRRFPNHQMAARIATIPEAFSRSLKVFKSNGDIECSYQTIHIQRPERLTRVAQLGPHPSAE